jgi:hypothetical protein
VEILEALLRDPDAPVPDPILSPLNWRETDPAILDKKRRTYAAAIARVLTEQPALKGTPLHLAIGEASAVATTKQDKILWLEEVRKRVK